MSLLEIYDYYVIQISDHRSIKWPMIGSMIPLLLVTFAYLYFVLIYGPRYMKDKKPYSFKSFIQWYNIFQIIANTAIVYHIYDSGWFQDGYWKCTGKMEYSYSRNSYKMVVITWYILCMKLIDYTETILFVLRKKFQQVSFLHLYHHVSTMWIVWCFVKYSANGYALTHAGLNAMIHVMMYTYYLLASRGPKMQKILAPIKPMITLAQMAQFVILILYAVLLLIVDCPGSRTVSIVMVIDLSINFILFYNFYRQSYVKKRNKVNKE